MYTVTIQDENTCRKVDTLQVNVFKQAYVNAGPDQFIVFGDPVRLNGKADPGEILWKAAQKLSCDTCLQTLTHTDTTASFVLQLTDQYGCKAYDTLLVQVEGVLYLPNTFTPNQDGLNDTFGALYVDVMAYRLEIFNRWRAKKLLPQPTQILAGMVHSKAKWRRTTCTRTVCALPSTLAKRVSGSAGYCY